MSLVGAGQRKVGEAQLFVRADERPEVRLARVRPRVVLPRLVADFAGPRDDAERPPRLAGAGVERLDVSGRLLLGLAARRSCARRPSRRRRRPGGRCSMIEPWPAVRGPDEVHASVLPQRRDRPARCQDRARSRYSPRMTNRRARCRRSSTRCRACCRRSDRAPVRRETAAAPRSFGRCRIERFDQSDAVRGVEHAVDHQGRGAKIV